MTLCFTDIVESSALAQTMGNRHWAQLLQWHNETIGSIVESYGGEVVKTLGCVPATAGCRGWQAPGSDEGSGPGDAASRVTQ